MDFFLAAKLFWLVAAPGTLLIAFISVGVLLQATTPFQRLGFRITSSAATALLLLMCLPAGGWLLQPLENRFPAPRLPLVIDGIVVLGGMVDPWLSQARQKIAITDAAERLTETLTLARQFPDARIIVSGGSASLTKSSATEAFYMKEFLIEQGIAASRVTAETASRNTAENAVYSRNVARAKPTETWILVTSAAHMPRAVGCFDAIGWPVIPFPVDYHTPVTWGFSLSQLDVLDHAVREWIGLIAYRMSGRTRTLLPGPLLSPT
jgi:uncharacterized SAM-binding protein YcdF (DUF218 family)